MRGESKRTPIRVLPPEVAEKIAAGEVVQRPESVVKELLENSLDAGAKRIEVSLVHGGKDLVRVQDDGTGIPPEELPFSVARYATSKISRFQDLWKLSSLGFRGEALASIGYVASLTVTSKVENGEGARITVNGGKVGEVVPASCPEGTLVEAKDLFFSVPARRRFLRRDATEFGRASQWVVRAALSSPKTGIKLESDGKVVWNVLPDSTILERVAVFFGPEVAGKLLEVKHDGPVSVSGFVGRPEVWRGDRRHEFFFINGRFIQDGTIRQALEEAFRGYLVPRRFPFALLRVSLDPERLDVNVHPGKAEVKYENGQEVFRAVFRAVRKSLASLGPRVIDTPGEEKNSKGASKEVGDFFVDSPEARRKPPQAPGVSGEKTSPYKGSDYSGRTMPQPPEPESTEKLKPPPVSESSSGLRSPLTAKPLRGDVAQVRGSYLILEAEDGIEIVDQHALHERILYEKILQRLKSTGIPMQALLIPVTLKLEATEVTKVQENLDTFKKLGVAVKVPGPGTIRIESVPSLGKEGDPERIFREILAKLSAASDEEAWKPLAAALACSLAVKSGTQLNAGQASELLSQASELESGDTCPHGRPTKLKLTFKDLERHFDRR